MLIYRRVSSEVATIPPVPEHLQKEMEEFNISLVKSWHEYEEDQNMRDLMIYTTKCFRVLNGQIHKNMKAEAQDEVSNSSKLLSLHKDAPLSTLKENLKEYFGQGKTTAI